MTDLQTRIGVIGAGAWGTALAIIANRAGSQVTLYSRNAALVESMQQNRENAAYLPGCFLDPAITITSHLPDVTHVQWLIIAIPSQSLRTMCIKLSDMITADIPLALACKGIERGSLALMSEVVQSSLPANPVAVISGPNFAAEIASGLPAATAIACTHQHLAQQLVYALGSRYFRPYISDDLAGVQIGGAVKNVLAIACGIAEGKELGDNARAALLTRGITEMMRLAATKGGNPQTLMGLAGMGDLVLTATSTQSRNYRLGMKLGQGTPPAEALGSGTRRLVEGVTTAESIYELSMKIGVDMPICSMVHEILRGTISVDNAIAELLERPFVVE